ncbi:MAG: fimbria/pilus outer membrane usher protein, partial [Vulcanimicrobiaceae bacterium]
FEAVGFQVRPGYGQRATVWYGDGKLRRTARINYELKVGKFTFRDQVSSNAEVKPYSYEAGIESRYDENAEATYNPSSQLAFSLRLNRNLSSTGSTTSLMTFESRLNLPNFTVMLRPSYDKVNHVVSATLELTQRIRDIHQLQETVTRNAREPYGATLSYQKTQRDQDDPWSWRVQDAEGVNQMREVTLEDRMPWTNARIVASDQNGIGNVNAELTGGLAAAGLGINALRTIEQEEVLGVVRLPGFPGVRIDVNGSPAGFTDGNGNLILRRLSALQENVILADLSTIPLGVGVKDPLPIVPLPSTPVSIDMLAPKAQSLLLRIVDAAGKPLPPASWIKADDGTEFPIGFDGRAFLRGMTPGTHTFSAQGLSCSLQV